MDQVLHCISEISSDAWTQKFCGAAGDKEIEDLVFQLWPLKAPESDGFPGIFYQKYYLVVCQGVTEMVRSIAFSVVAYFWWG